MRSLTVFILASLLTLAPLSAQERQTLRLGHPLTGTLTAEAVHLYTLDLAENDWVYGEVDQETVDVVVTVLGPEGGEVLEVDGPSRGPEPFTFEAEGPGTYTIRVTPFEKNEGDYVIALLRAEPVARDPAERVDQLMAPYTGDDRPGGVVAVVKDGEMVFSRAYGMANLTYGIPFQVETASNIGSVTKQFTAMGILLLQTDGKLSLEDDIRNYIPELPDFGVRITIRRLLTHTSGYREIYNFLPMSGFQMEDAFPREMAIRIIQNQPELQAEPNTEYNYNNTAFILLATTIERVTGQTFPQYMKERVFEPLGMTHTRVEAQQGEVIPGSATGYVPAETGGFLYVKDLAASYGAGGIYTTVQDLARWMLNYRDMTVGGPEVIEAMTTRNVLASGDTTDYGLGIGVGEFRGQRRLQHTGGDVAHRTYFGYYPDIQSGVMVMSNNASFNLGLATNVTLAFFADAFEPEAAEEESVTEAVGPSEEELEAMAGSWVVELPGASLAVELTVDGGALQAHPTGQSPIRLTATSDSTFTYSPADILLTLHKEEDGTYERATLTQNGEHPMKRREVAPLTPQEMEAFAGRYFCKELETFYDVFVEEGELKLRSFFMEPVTLAHQDGESFGGGGFPFETVVFQRAQNGTVNGFTAGNGRVVGVWFQKW